MTRLALLALLAGCGRIDFAEHIDATLTGDATGQCTARRIPSFDYGVTGATDLAVAAIPTGYAVGALFGASTLWGVALDGSLTASTSTPSHTTPAFPTDGIYTNASLYFDGANLAGSTTLADGTMYFKTFALDMTGFLVAVVHPGKVGEPSIARANGTTLYSFLFSGTTIQYVTLLADGSPDTTDHTFTISSATVGTMSVADGPSVVVVYDGANGSCGLGGIDALGGISNTTLATPCTNPRVYNSNGDLYAAYESGSTIMMVPLTATTNASVTAGQARMVGAGLAPRFARMPSGTWVTWHDNSRLHLAPVTTLADATIGGAPAGPPDAYEAAGPYVFAIWGSQLWAITCP